MERTLTSAESGFVAGMAASMITGILLISLVCWVLTIIATWRIFKKAGEPGWKAIIPIYNIYMMFKIVGMKGWFWGCFAVSIVACIMTSFAVPYQYVEGSTQLVAYDFSANPGALVCLILCLVFFIVADIIYSYRTSKAFGHGGGYAVGLFFLPFIFWMILGFGQSKYNKKAALKK